MSPSTTSVSFKEALLTFFFVFLIAIIALSYLIPPAVVPASAPATDFSAERAMEHLRVIAREPHPTGSTANARVRDSIVERLTSLGLGPDLQKSVSTPPWGVGGRPYGPGTIRN